MERKIGNWFLGFAYLNIVLGKFLPECTITKRHCRENSNCRFGCSKSPVWLQVDRNPGVVDRRLGQISSRANFLLTAFGTRRLRVSTRLATSTSTLLSRVMERTGFHPPISP